MLVIGIQATGLNLQAQDSKWVNLPSPATQQSTEPQGYFVTKSASPAVASEATHLSQLANSGAVSGAAASGVLPLWFYNVVSPRDQNGYFGIMVGRDPFNGGGTARVSTYIVPIIIRVHQIGVSANQVTGVITSEPGLATFNPTVADTACMSSPNNVPATVVRESPLFSDAHFSFGGTSVGTTQYVDAFQRASFWKVEDKDDFHVLLNPVTMTPAILIDVPAIFGTTRPASTTFRTTCGPQAIVDINWFDFYLNSVVIPALAPAVNSASFPVFQLYNTVLADVPSNLILLHTGLSRYDWATDPDLWRRGFRYDEFLFRGSAGFGDSVA